MNKAFWLLGGHLTILANQSVTDGRYDLIEGRFAAGTAVPLHKHTRYAEQIIVLEGEFTVQLDQETHILGVGDTIMIPMNTPHSLKATGSSTSRGLTIASPSGFARLIQQTGTPVETAKEAPAVSQADMDRFVNVSTEIGDQLL